MKRFFVKKNFSPVTQGVINQANEIIYEYEQVGLKLTLRQLFYQFVSRGLFPNQERKYQALSGILSRARMCGKVDWDILRDPTRLIRRAHRHDYIAKQPTYTRFEADQWLKRPIRPEVWVEKDALSGIVEQICAPLCVDYLPCRGYPSSTAIWDFYNRFFSSDQRIQILYLGDHDPSGLMIFQNLNKRLNDFRIDVEVKRIGLNFEQINQYDLPPNPAKRSDVNANWYIGEYGKHTWEVDALEPTVLRGVIREAVEGMRV